MRRLLSIAVKNLPLLAKRLAFFTALYYHQSLLFPQHFSCANHFPTNFGQNIKNIEDKIIRIQYNGDIVGYAYCFSQNHLVSASFDLIENKHSRREYEYFLGDTKLKGNFKLLDHYENLAFIEFTLSDKITQLPAYQLPAQIYPFEISIIQMKEFLGIKQGYFVAEDSGYGIVDGKGEVGSLIVQNGSIVGIVTHIGRDSEAGFLRLIQWRHLPRLLEYIKGKKFHLGISAQSLQSQQGITVVRIAPNSLMPDVMMGDVILKANGQKLRNPQSLQRIFIESSSVNLTILRQEKLIEIEYTSQMI